MKKNYDFSRGRRGAVVPIPPGKTRITIRLDDDILDWFRDQVDSAGGGNYQTLINTALREYMAQRRESIETTVRRVVREEFAKYRTATKKGRR
jgi:BrnA antitoxin of type II toxin-antitoxin system